MFEQTFVDGVGKTNKSWTVTLSFVLQLGIIGLLVILPLIFTDVLPKAQLVSLLQKITNISRQRSGATTKPVFYRGLTRKNADQILAYH